jgi:Tfp pilus assembly protein FimT
MQTRQRQQQAGFTLIEAVIAALILLVAIVFVAQIFVTAIQQNRTSRQYTHATAIAQSKLEELNAIPIERLQYGGDLGKDGKASAGVLGFTDFVAVDTLDPGKVGVVPTREQANYTRYWMIEPDPGGWANVYRITVRVVAITPGKGIVREDVTLSTIRAQY